jgi:hypothetical protein
MPLQVLPSHRGLAIQARDEGIISAVEFYNVTLTTQLDEASWFGAGEPIYVSTADRTEGPEVRIAHVRARLRGRTHSHARTRTRAHRHSFICNHALCPPPNPQERNAGV